MTQTVDLVGGIISVGREVMNEGSGVGEVEVTVTSELQAQAERTEKHKREEKAPSSEGSDRGPEPEDGG